MNLIHISWAGSFYKLSVHGKIWHMEDHSYCGPIFLNAKGDPLTNQPPEGHHIWDHVNAWYQQGKRFKEINGHKWLVYETQMQGARRRSMSLK